MPKYRFIVVFDKELTHDEINKLEIALSVQCDDYGPFVAQLLEIEKKDEPEDT